jgi:hypothetical protein
MPPLGSDPYERFKSNFNASYTKFRWRLVFMLFDHPDLGDPHPSQLLDALLSLPWSDKLPGDLRIGHFFHCLLADMHAPISTAGFQNHH